jgi:adenylate cyclase class IV
MSLMCYPLFTNAKQAKAVYEFKNIKSWLHKTTAAIWYNKSCRDLHLTPKYISIKIKGNKRQNSNTLKAATHFRINQEIRFLYIKKSKLNEQLYAKHLECASTWSIYWTTILEALGSSLQAEMEKYYNKLKKNWTTFKQRTTKATNTKTATHNRRSTPALSTWRISASRQKNKNY